MSGHNYRERHVANKYTVTSAATKQRQGPATPKLLDATRTHCRCRENHFVSDHRLCTMKGGCRSARADFITSLWSPYLIVMIIFVLPVNKYIKFRRQWLGQKPIPCLKTVMVGAHSSRYRSGGTPSRHTDRQLLPAWESWPDWLTQNGRWRWRQLCFTLTLNPKSVTARNFYWMWKTHMLCLCSQFSEFRPWKIQILFCTGVRTWQKYFVCICYLWNVCVFCMCYLNTYCTLEKVNYWISLHLDRWINVY